MFYNRGMRNVIIIAMTVIMLSFCVIRLFDLQIINGETYRKNSEDKLYLSSKITAPRGDILDRYGNVLVTNRTGYSIRVTKGNFKDKEVYEFIYMLVKMVGDKFEAANNLPITDEAPYKFSFNGKDDTENENLKVKWLKEHDMDVKFSANRVLAKLAKDYGVENMFSEKYERKMLGIIFDMKYREFNMYNPYMLATDVPVEVVAVVKENKNKFKCLEIVEEPVRAYPNGTLAAHILGNVGMIFAEEYEKLKDQNYSLDAKIGKQGAELAFEKYLKGDDGLKGFEQTTDGLGEKVITKPAKHGNNVFLTIDLQLQKAMEESLADTIWQISSSVPDCHAGSAVCIDVNSGEILAMASYPNYHPAEYNLKYDELVKNPGNPIWNRAIGGAYEPGSTFKMVTAIASMEEGIITPDETIYDSGVYRYFKDYQPQCLEYRYGKTHGFVDVEIALQESCNYYFYDVGRRLGIDKLYKYSKMFGFGQYANIEIGGEVTGQIASRENKEKRGEIWNPGDILQASIGQSETLITPLQLANYAATIANGGKRYQPHILKSVKDYDTGSLVTSSEIKVIDSIDIGKENLSAVKAGMRKVTEEGTAKSVFEGFPIAIAGKTGTAEVPNGSSNGLFVAYAPAENPQIAIAIVIEHGSGGYMAAPVARAVFEKYFEHGDIIDTRTVNTLTK